MTEPTDDTCIELAAALEMHRALHIVASVGALPVGGKNATTPTPFQSGYQLACEEIEERIRTQELTVPGGATLPLCGTLPSVSQPSQRCAGLKEMKCGIYVASRASAPERPAMWRGLRDAGWPIVSTWIDEADEGQTGSFTELWERIEREIRGSCGLVIYAEPEDFPLKGAYIEVGIALGAGLPVAVVLPRVSLEPRSDRPIGSWIRHPRVTVCETLDEARDIIEAQSSVFA